MFQWKKGYIALVLFFSILFLAGEMIHENYGDSFLYSELIADKTDSADIYSEIEFCDNDLAVLQTDLFLFEQVISSPGTNDDVFVSLGLLFLVWEPPR